MTHSIIVSYCIIISIIIIIYYSIHTAYRLHTSQHLISWQIWKRASKYYKHFTSLINLVQLVWICEERNIVFINFRKLMIACTNPHLPTFPRMYFTNFCTYHRYHSYVYINYIIIAIELYLMSFIVSSSVKNRIALCIFICRQWTAITDIICLSVDANNNYNNNNTPQTNTG